MLSKTQQRLHNSFNLLKATKCDLYISFFGIAKLIQKYKSMPPMLHQTPLSPASYTKGNHQLNSSASRATTQLRATTKKRVECHGLTLVKIAPE